MPQIGIDEFSTGLKEDENGLIVNIHPAKYIDYFLRLIINYESIDSISDSDKFRNLDKMILDEYINRFDAKEEITIKKLCKVIESEKELVNDCLGLVLSRRVELMNHSVDKLKYNPGMIYALTDASRITKRDVLYAAACEKFVHGTSTAFGNLRERETKEIKKKDSHHVFGISTSEVKLKDKSSFDLVLLIIENKLVREIKFIQMSSGPNCKNFTHAIQINNVKDWFKNICGNSLETLKDYIKKKERKDFETLINKLKNTNIDEDLIKIIVGQAYGDSGMTASMMKIAGVNVVRGVELWELITGIEGMNPFRAEKVAGIIILNVYKQTEPIETQKMSFWEMLEYRMLQMEKDLDLNDFSID